MNNTCDRCHQMQPPRDLLHICYCRVDTSLCFFCYAKVRTDLRALPPHKRGETLQQWQQLWQESKMERRGVAG